MEFPKSLRTVSQTAFFGCGSLKSVKFAEGLEILETDKRSLNDNYRWCCGVFEGSALESITLPKTLKRIKHSVFKKCICLKNIIFPAKLEHIGECCFYESALESVEFPSTLTTIGDSAFEGCRDLKKVKISDGLERISDRCFFGSGITEFVVPKSVTEIGKCVFHECNALKRISF